MSIVIELQREIIENKSDVLNLLRKAKLISKKLDVEDFHKWVCNELNGYEQNEVPSYRKIHGTLKGKHPYNGWIHVICQDSKMQDLITNQSLNEPISHILSLAKSESTFFVKDLGIDACTHLSSSIGFSTVFRIEFPISNLDNIIDQIINTILDWTLLLEENNILGENLKFSSDEKDTAKSDPKITNYITNIYGNVENTQFQQGNDGSSQQK